MGSKRQPINGIAANQPRPVISPQQNVQGNQSYVPPGGIALRPFTPDPSLYTPQVAESMQNVANLQKFAVDNYNQSVMSQQKLAQQQQKLAQQQQLQNKAAQMGGRPPKYPTAKKTPAPVQETPAPIQYM
jgi:hypothetical protein